MNAATTSRIQTYTQTYTVRWDDYLGRLHTYTTEAECASGAINRLFRDLDGVCGVQWVENAEGRRV